MKRDLAFFGSWFALTCSHWEFDEMTTAVNFETGGIFAGGEMTITLDVQFVEGKEVR